MQTMASIHPFLRGCIIAPEKSFTSVLSFHAFQEIRKRLKELRLYNWLTFEGGWNEDDTREFYSHLSVVDGQEDVITWASGGASFSFTIQDISIAIGVPISGKSLEEVTAGICSVELSQSLMGYDATERLDVRRGPMHAAIFARAAQTNLIPVLNPKTAMRRHSLLLLLAVDSDSRDVGFNLPRVIFREMVRVVNYLRWGKKPHVLGFPFTIVRLMALHGMPVGEPDRHIHCYSFQALYPLDTPVALKKRKYAHQHKMEEKEDQIIEEVLGEVQSVKKYVSHIHKKIQAGSVKSNDVPNEESHNAEILEKQPSLIRAKTGPYAPSPEDVVADIVQKKLLADCVFVRQWPHLSLSSRELFSIVGDSWTSWISDTIMDSYIGYMRQTIGIGPSLVICSSHIVSLLQQFFSYRSMGDGETGEKAKTIDLENDEQATLVSNGRSHKGKKGKAALHKRMKTAQTREDDNFFPGFIADLRKKSKITVPLAEIESLLIPICDGNHWHLFQIFGKDGYGRLLNSDFHCKLGKNIAILIERWWRCDNLHEGIKPKKFSFAIPTDVPQQENPHDCGVFVLKFMECIISGKDFDFTCQDVTEFRWTIFRNLLNYPGAERVWEAW